jgi:hypothetical protein
LYMTETIPKYIIKPTISSLILPILEIIHNHILIPISVPIDIWIQYSRNKTIFDSYKLDLVISTDLQEIIINLYQYR